MLVTGGVAWLASLGSAALYLALHDWRRAADLAGMAAWSLPLAGIVAFAARWRIWALPGRALSLATAVLLGSLVGLAYFALAARLHGGWRLAFPAFVCWAFGGAAGLIASVALNRPNSRTAAFLLTVAMLVGVVWVYGQLDGMERAAADQRVDSSLSPISPPSSRGGPEVRTHAAVLLRGSAEAASPARAVRTADHMEVVEDASPPTPPLRQPGVLSQVGARN